MRWRSWFRRCATSRKGAGAIPDYVIGIFLWYNTSGRTMVLGSTQLLTEGGQCLGLTLPSSFAECLDVRSGPGSSVGIATDYELDGPGFESGGARFSARPAAPGAHPTSCTMGTGSFPGVKYGRGVLLTTHPLLVMEE